MGWGNELKKMFFAVVSVWQDYGLWSCGGCEGGVL